MNKTKILGVFLGVMTAVLIAGCSMSKEEAAASKSAIDTQLPAGCEFNYYGMYGNLHVGAVICDAKSGKKVSSTELDWTYRSGKTTHHRNLSILNVQESTL